MSKEKVDKLRKTICRKNSEALQMQAEIEQLRQSSASLFRKRNEQLLDANARLWAENEQLRGLLRQCQPFVDRLQPPTLDLSVEIAEELKRKEVGDE